MDVTEHSRKSPVLALSAQMRVAASMAAPEIRGFATMIEEEWLPEAERLEGAVEALEKIARGDYLDNTTARGRRNYGPAGLRKIAKDALDQLWGAVAMAEVDNLGVLGHWTVWRCRECGLPTMTQNATEVYGLDDTCTTHDAPEPVEYVPASQRAAAVEENERLRQIADEAYRSLLIGRVDEAREYLRSLPTSRGR